MLRSRIATISDKKSKMLDLLGNPPLLTITVTIVCTVLFLAQVASTEIGSVCFLPSLVVTRFQIYRIFTYPFFHANFFHILFNLVAWVIMVKEFERDVGTLGVIYTIFVLFVPIGSILHGTAAYLLDMLARTTARNECCIGLSGILFAVLVVNIESSGASSVSFFGLFSLPSRWYPWLLALILQLLSPRLSFFGHISGIVVGYGLALGYFNKLTPSDYKLMEIEEALGLQRLPLWQSVQHASGLGIGIPSGLPRTTDSDETPYSVRVQRYWQKITSWFSGRSTAQDESAQPFVGRGHMLGGGNQSSPVGRIPPNSRLLIEAEAVIQDQQAFQQPVEPKTNEPEPEVNKVPETATNDETEKQ